MIGGVFICRACGFPVPEARDGESQTALCPRCCACTWYFIEWIGTTGPRQVRSDASRRYAEVERICRALLAEEEQRIDKVRRR